MTKQICSNAEVRDAILDAAHRLIQHYGYCKTTVDDIAREAGIGKGTIYLHFHSKEEVARSCVDRKHYKVIERLREIAHSPGEPADRVRGILLERILARFDSVQGWAQSLDELYSALRPALLLQREQHHEAEAEVLAEVLIEGRIQGKLDVPEALPAARTMILATSALLPYSLTAKQLGEREDLERSLNRIVDMLLYGIIRRDEPAVSG